VDAPDPVPSPAGRSSWGQRAGRRWAVYPAGSDAAVNVLRRAPAAARCAVTPPLGCLRAGEVGLQSDAGEIARPRTERAEGSRSRGCSGPGSARGRPWVSASPTPGRRRGRVRLWSGVGLRGKAKAAPGPRMLRTALGRSRAAPGLRRLRREGAGDGGVAAGWWNGLGHMEGRRGARPAVERRWVTWEGAGVAAGCGTAFGLRRKGVGDAEKASGQTETAPAIAARRRVTAHSPSG
jgi:hypothetical protein